MTRQIYTNSSAPVQYVKAQMRARTLLDDLTAQLIAHEAVLPLAGVTWDHVSTLTKLNEILVELRIALATAIEQLQ